MKGKKIFNDPVYGFIGVPYGIIFDLVEHPYFQRLRRIKQVGLTHYVYPGALHTRFHHALGALHLMTEAIDVLRYKGVEITDDEAQAVSIAILLHDIGHGPFSHALEHTLVNVHHEELSILFMEQLNKDFDGALSLAIEIFCNRYSKPFLHQLVSGQLDMDRMDYLNRDSFFTGVHEGVIGYDRIIKMLSVYDGQLVVEEKGIYSIEKFLVARRLMYWQVYLHKTSLAAEQMLIKVLQRAKELAQSGVQLEVPESLAFFLYNEISAADFSDPGRRLLDQFAQLDDFDVVMALKMMRRSEDVVLRELSQRLINRQLFRVELKNDPFPESQIEGMREEVKRKLNLADNEIDYFVFGGQESNRAYTTLKDEIYILFKNGTVSPLSSNEDIGIQPKNITKHYLCYPKKL
jgi:HD superfamily phosphohydrolase